VYRSRVYVRDTEHEYSSSECVSSVRDGASVTEWVCGTFDIREVSVEEAVARRPTTADKKHLTVSQLQAKTTVITKQSKRYQLSLSLPYPSDPAQSFHWHGGFLRAQEEE
jgi:hypothetical protein